MFLIFLRHSEYEQPNGVPSALLPHAITDEGKNQAITGAKKLIEFFNKKNITPTRIISSSLLRAYQTGRIIQNELNGEINCNIDIVETDQLTERKMGSMANLTVSEIESIMLKDPRYETPPKGWKSSRNYKLPYIDTESLKEAGERVFQLINTEFDKEVTIFVGHGASFRNACIEFGILKEEDLPKLSMFYASPIIFERQKKNWNLVFGEWKIRQQKDKID